MTFIITKWKGGKIGENDEMIMSFIWMFLLFNHDDGQTHPDFHLQMKLTYLNLCT